MIDLSLMDKHFQKFAGGVSRMLGSVWTVTAVLALLVGSGVIFGFSEDWVKFVEFTIAIGTFLILFFLQKSQNVGDKATHAKLDELIRAVGGARNEFTSVEDKHEAEIDRMKSDIAEECENDDPTNDEQGEESIENLNQAQEETQSRNR